VDLTNDKALAALGGFEAYQDKEKREGPFGKPDYSVVGQWKGLFANWILRTV